MDNLQIIADELIQKLDNRNDFPSWIFNQLISELRRPDEASVRDVARDCITLSVAEAPMDVVGERTYTQSEADDREIERLVLEVYHREQTAFRLKVEDGRNGLIYRVASSAPCNGWLDDVLETTTGVTEEADFERMSDPMPGTAYLACEESA